MQSRRFATVVTLVIVVAFFLVAIAPAFASPAPGTLPFHARLVSSEPADRANVETADRVVLTFNESINPDFVAVRVSGPEAAEVDGAPSVEGATVTQPLAAPLAAGEHTVTYRVVSNDGHPISGTVTFTSTAVAATASPTASTPTSTAEASPTPTVSTASATPMPSDSPTTTPEPVADEAGTSPWVGVGIAVGVAALAAVLGLVWHRRRSRPDDLRD